MSKTQRFQPTANPALHAAMVGKRSSGAAGTHADKRTRRARTRNASRSVAIRESRNGD